MHNVQETRNTVSKQTRNIVFVTSIYAILIDFAFEFKYMYKLLTLYRDCYQKHISAKTSFRQKCLYEVLTRCHRFYIAVEINDEMASNCGT